MRALLASSCSRCSSCRSLANCRAALSSFMARMISPAWGTSEKPKTSTGVEGPASLTFSPRSFIIARTRPQAVPAIMGSPTRKVPLWTRTVATGPRPLSNLASMTVPMANRSGLAFSSDNSATSRIISSNSSMPSFFRAETGTQIVSPPHSSTTRPYSVSCCLIRSGWASGRSILFRATIIGTSAALAWFMASTVWGITPSSAATTRTAMSVTWAPRARIAVKASWPGVSKKTIFFP